VGADQTLEHLYHLYQIFCTLKILDVQFSLMVRARAAGLG
jgi:hypothetical protein